MNESRGIDISGWGVTKGNTISINSVQSNNTTYATIGQNYDSSTQDYHADIYVGDTSSLPTSTNYNQYYLGIFSGEEIWIDYSSSSFTDSSSTLDKNKVMNISWKDKTSDTLIDVRMTEEITLSDPTQDPSEGFYRIRDATSGRAIYDFKNPVGNINISNGELVTKSNTRVRTSLSTYENVNLGLADLDAYDSWEFVYFYYNLNKQLVMSRSDTFAGQSKYPPSLSDGEIGVGYLLVGFGTSEPDGSVNNSGADFKTDGTPNFKQKIYHDIRWRDQRTVSVSNNQLQLSDTPYGTTTFSLNVSTNQYVDKYISIGSGKRSVDCSFTLDDGSGYDTVNYGATLKVGRKSANNADGQGYPLWGSYTQSDGARGHFQQIRQDATYGEYVLSPKVWGKNYTLLQSADIMPDPNNPEKLALRLTFHNYSSSYSDGSFNLKVNWHAL